MKFAAPKKLGEIAAAFRVPLQDPSHADILITGINTADSAEEGDIVWAESKEAVQGLASSQAAAALVPSTLKDAPIPVIAHPLPKLLFGKLLEELIPKDEGDVSSSVIDPTAEVDSRAVIRGNVRIGARTQVRAGAVVGHGCVLGEDCVVGYNAILNWGTQVGNRVIVHGGTVLGTDGFGYVQKPVDNDPTTWESLKVPHAGRVVIEDDVEIGANVCIDRGMLSDTVVGKGTKIDNLVQIGHNCRIGPHNILVGLAGLSGSITTGKNVIVAGQAGVADHTHIGDRAILMAATKVAGQVPADSKMMGYPPLPRGDFWKYTSSLMDVTLVKKILKAAANSASFEDFKHELSKLKSIGWTFKK
jgi:UDP-3-O-[3-hydroxymyristoyl] glucosamine N-acyltransferase